MHANSFPSSPGTRQVEDIDLSFFARALQRTRGKFYRLTIEIELSLPGDALNITRYVDIDMDHAAITKSTRKKKKAQAGKKTKQVMLSFLDYPHPHYAYPNGRMNCFLRTITIACANWRRII